MVSIERLLSLISPKAISIEPIAGKGLFSTEDAAGLLGQVQHLGYAVGIRVLEAKIGGNSGSKLLLIGAVTDSLISAGMEPIASRAIAEIAVSDVCGTGKCEKCHGTGESYSMRYNRIFKCGRCQGTGEHFPKMRDYATWFALLTKSPCSTEDFRNRYYDRLMDAIDTLSREEGEAARQCRKMLNLTEQEVA